MKTLKLIWNLADSLFCLYAIAYIGYVSVWKETVTNHDIALEILFGTFLICNVVERQRKKIMEQWEDFHIGPMS